MQSEGGEYFCILQPCLETFIAISTPPCHEAEEHMMPMTHGSACLQGEGFPEDFVPFKDLAEAVSAKY